RQLIADSCGWIQSDARILRNVRHRGPAHAAQFVAAQTQDRRPADRDLALDDLHARTGVTEQGQREGGLAAARLPDECEDPPALYGDADSVDDGCTGVEDNAQAVDPKELGIHVRSEVALRAPPARSSDRGRARSRLRAG